VGECTRECARFPEGSTACGRLALSAFEEVIEDLQLTPAERDELETNRRWEGN
jgi:hypothetical protein